MRIWRSRRRASTGCSCPRCCRTINSLVQQLVDPASRSKGSSAGQAGAYAVCVTEYVCIYYASPGVT